MFGSVTGSLPSQELGITPLIFIIAGKQYLESQCWGLCLEPR